AGLAGDQGDEVRRARLEDVGGLVDDLAAGRGTHGRPLGEGGLGGVAGGLGVGHGGGGGDGGDLAGHRVAALEGGPARGGDLPPPDQKIDVHGLPPNAH